VGERGRGEREREGEGKRAGAGRLILLAFVQSPKHLTHLMDRQTSCPTPLSLPVSLSLSLPQLPELFFQVSSPFTHSPSLSLSPLPLSLSLSVAWQSSRNFFWAQCRAF